MLDFLKDLYRVFMREEVDKLTPHYRPDIDHSIELVEKEGKTAEIL